MLCILTGYLKMETLLYVWDNYVIGLDAPGFSTEWLAVVCATMLGLMQDKLKEAKAVSVPSEKTIVVVVVVGDDGDVVPVVIVELLLHGTAAATVCVLFVLFHNVLDGDIYDEIGSDRVDSKKSKDIL